MVKPMYESHRPMLKSMQDAWNASHALSLMSRRCKAAKAETPAAGFSQARSETDGGEDDRWIQLDIHVGKLYQLLAGGAISVTDFRCRDHAAKCCVRTLCLQACSHGLNGSAVGDGSGARRCQDCLS